MCSFSLMLSLSLSLAHGLSHLPHAMLDSLVTEAKPVAPFPSNTK